MPDDRIIPTNLGGTDYLYEDLPLVGRVEFEDALIALVPIFAAFYIAASIPNNLQFLSIFLYAIGAFSSYALLSIKPDYMSLYDYLNLEYDFRVKRNHEFEKQRNKTIEALRDSGASAKDTRELIRLERIYPNHGIIERPDGVMVGFVKMSGVNLDITGTNAELSQHVQALQSVMNDRVEEDIQLYLPKRQYDPSEHISKLDDRLSDPEATQNQLLQEYILDRMDFHQILSERGFYRQYYVVVNVGPSEVVANKKYKKSGLAKVIEGIPLPMIEEFYYFFTNVSRGLLSTEEIRYKQMEKCEDKCEKVAQYMSGNIGGRTEVLDATESAVVLKEFWQGRTVTSDEAEGLIREQPYVMGGEEEAEESGSDNSFNTLR